MHALVPPPSDGEFGLIRRHFTRPERPLPASVVLGVGDDCALLQPSAGHQLAISTDMLVEGRHFLPGTDPEALGHKALAVNLSDLAAMGARPLGFTLALGLPARDDAWLSAFARGLHALADRCACPLVGGDTTRSPLVVLTVTVFGELLPGQALRRGGAAAGDDVWLSGRTGEARLALALHRGEAWARAALIPTAEADACRRRMDRPEPRLALGQALAGVASAAIDVSDGLAGDLGHILAASRLGAELELDALPLAPALAALPDPWRLECLLHGGDDYELVFCAPPALRPRIEALAAQAQTPVTRIGRLDDRAGLRGRDRDGQVRALPARGYDHFAAPGHGRASAG
jgi:thiamine-monophosphate kinase